MARRPLSIGITCYPTFGGSGVIATEIGKYMAQKGHRVHFVCSDIPGRLTKFTANIFFHQVDVVDYPVFNYPPYSINLASKMVQVATSERLDILHVHYAVPHATSAYLARQVLGQIAPKVITTLHGTDITLVGNDPSYLPITRFSIFESDGVTAPSQYLKQATYEKLNLSTVKPIEIIHNFVDTERFSPVDRSKTNPMRSVLGKCPIASGIKVLAHVSNFRALKRVPDVIRIFAQVRKQIPSHLLLIGDGPERAASEQLARELGVADSVSFLGKMESFVELLQCADLFLLPSATESFGLAALEAMACGCPVIASNVDGIPEVVVHGETGFLATLGDVEQMSRDAVRLLADEALHRRFSDAARLRAVTEFQEPTLCGQYEDYYYKILG